MKIHGQKVQKHTIVEKILRSMSIKFNYVVCTIEKSNNDEEVSIDKLQGFLLVHAHKMKPVKDKDKVLIVSNGTSMTRIGRGHGVFQNAQG